MTCFAVDAVHVFVLEEKTDALAQVLLRHTAHLQLQVSECLASVPTGPAMGACQATLCGSTPFIAEK